MGSQNTPNSPKGDWQSALRGSDEASLSEEATYYFQKYLEDHSPQFQTKILNVSLILAP